MKNILIMGIGRAGKTTLSKMIKDKCNSYNLLHSDSLKWAIIRAKDKEAYYRKNVDKQKEYEHGEFFQRTLLELFNSLTKKDTNNYGYILESGQLSVEYVKKMVDFSNTIVVCLGLGDLTKEEMVMQCLEYDTKESWTYGLPKDYLLKHASDWYESNKVLKKECLKYDIKYVDTSKNRYEILENLVEEILDKAK